MPTVIAVYIFLYNFGQEYFFVGFVSTFVWIEWSDLEKNRITKFKIIDPLRFFPSETQISFIQILWPYFKA